MGNKEQQEKKEFIVKDKLYINSVIKLTIWERIKLLVCPELRVNHLVDCADIMPIHRAAFTVTPMSYRAKYIIKRNRKR